MSLNINMKMIRPVNSCGSMLISDMNSWTLLQSCNVVNPEEIFLSNFRSSVLRRLCPKFCIVMNL